MTIKKQGQTLLVPVSISPQVRLTINTIFINVLTVRITQPDSNNYPRLTIYRQFPIIFAKIG
jgi:hypothetical protein